MTSFVVFCAFMMKLYCSWTTN